MLTLLCHETWEWATRPLEEECHDQVQDGHGGGKNRQACEVDGDETSPTTRPKGLHALHDRALPLKTSRSTLCPSKRRFPRLRKFESAPDPNIETIIVSLSASFSYLVIKNLILRPKRSDTEYPMYGKSTA